MSHTPQQGRSASHEWQEREATRFPKGWDHESLEEFERRWLRGDTTASISTAFDISPQWVCRIRKRMGLPTRCGPDGRWRGGPYRVGHTRRPPPTRPARFVACPIHHRMKKRCSCEGH